MKILSPLLMIFSLFLLNNKATAKELKIFFTERPPYFQVTQDKVSGITGDIINKTVKVAGINPVWIQVPAKRQMSEIKNNQEPGCAAGWFKNPEREKFAKFTHPIYRDRPTVVLSHQDYVPLLTNKSLDEISAMGNGVILVKNGYSYGKMIDDFLDQTDLTVLKTTINNFNMARLIAMKRADFMFMAEEEGRHLLESHDLKDFNLQLVSLSGMPQGNYRYLMCSMKTSDEDINMLNVALRQPLF